MKKILMLAIAFVSFSMITSCETDDDQASLQGKWEYFQEGFAINGIESLTTYDHQEGCTKDYSVFTAATIVDYNYFGSACEEEVMTIPFTRNGNDITVGSEEFSQAIEIKTLDANTLKLSVNDGETSGESYIVVYKRVN